MKRFLLIISFTIACYSVFAQNDKDSLPSSAVKKDWSKEQLSGRSADHFMLQLGYNGWSGETDSIRTKGLSRTFNIYFMFDFPFKSNPHFSAAAGVGLGTDNMFFKETTIELREYLQESHLCVLDLQYHRKILIYAMKHENAPAPSGQLCVDPAPIQSGRPSVDPAGLEPATL